jgi:cellobiose phosphorylase
MRFVHSASYPTKAILLSYPNRTFVYGMPPHIGRGGWTGYTGSAGWMYRLGLEAILGIRRVGQALQINPCIPKRWSSYQVTYRNGETTFQIRVENPSGVNRGVRQVTLDGSLARQRDSTSA